MTSTRRRPGIKLGYNSSIGGEREMRKSVGLVLGLCLCISAPVSAAEILTEEDFKQKIVLGSQLVRVADNALFIFDASGSMNKPFLDTGRSKYDAVLDQFKARNRYMPQPVSATTRSPASPISPSCKPCC